jgi:hypothetical protein
MKIKQFHGLKLCILESQVIIFNFFPRKLNCVASEELLING